MKRIILIVGVVVANLVLVSAVLTIYLRHRPATFLSKPPEHGLSFVIEADFSSAGGSVNGLAELKSAIQGRSAKLGLGVYWEPISESRVRVDVDVQDSADSESVSNALFRRGRLEFRLVHEDSDKLVESGEVPPGYEVLKREVLAPQAPKRIEQVLVKKETEPGLGGNLIRSAMAVRGNLDEPQIDFAMTPEGTAAFARVTRENVGRRLAIVLDGELYSAPVIRSPIEAGRAQITGSFDAREALGLANILEYPLPVHVTVVETKSF